MKRFGYYALVFAVAFSVVACGDDDDSSGGAAGAGGGSAGAAGGTATGPCSATSPAPGEIKGSCTVGGVLCQEYTGSGWTTELMTDVCSKASGTLGTGACATAGVLGSCQYQCGNSSEFVQHLYMTVDDMKALCEKDNGGKWLGP